MTEGFRPRPEDIVPAPAPDKVLPQAREIRENDGIENTVKGRKGAHEMYHVVDEWGRPLDYNQSSNAIPRGDAYTPDGKPTDSLEQKGDVVDYKE